MTHASRQRLDSDRESWLLPGGLLLPDRAAPATQVSHRGSATASEVLRWPAAALRAVWRACNVEVEAPSPDADIVRTSVVYFIGPGGAERYVAAPVAGHTSSGAAHLPAGQIAAWGRGIALLAGNLTS